MGRKFWDAAEIAAGQEYGKAQAAAYERREKFKRAAGWILVSALAAYLAARTWGPGIWEATRVPLLYGAGALLIFIGVGGLLYVAGRVRTKRRTRTYEPPSAYVREDW